MTDTPKLIAVGDKTVPTNSTPQDYYRTLEIDVLARTL